MTTRLTALMGLMTRLRFVCAVGGVLLGVNTSYASLLVGTVVTSGVETIPEINQLIASYNADFGASLPIVTAPLDKIEGQNSAFFDDGVFQLSDFEFYHQDDGGSTSLDIFDATVNFAASSLGAAAGFDTLDNPVFAFEQLSGPSFQYYVSKDGNLGWSLWAVMSGINPAYTDSGVGGFTRGNINDDSLAYDPINHGVSHISFYTATPEPSSLVLFGIMAAASCGFRPRCVR